MRKVLLFPNMSTTVVLRLQIERDKLMKEQQAREEMAQQKEELERRMTEYQEEANRTKDALVNFHLEVLVVVNLFCFVFQPTVESTSNTTLFVFDTRSPIIGSKELCNVHYPIRVHTLFV